MTPERWAEVGRLFEAASGVDPEDLPAFLERECGGDPPMKSEIESLLRSSQKADAFLEVPAAEALSPPAAPPRRSVGPYELLDEIGRGGMGVVFRAARRDQGFERFVAIKLVKRGMDTDFILRRFESERRILAGLDHPNIARVLDGGSTYDGVPYFVMELIDGRNLLQYCDEENLATTQRLALYRLVCSAAQYAHQRLVIHRDIKPGNILVTDEGVPKLLDFGLARILSSDAGETIDRTQTGLRVLTPEYASPEQIRGEAVTTSSDVYSLGVVLYELLTGERPYRLKTRSPEEVSAAVLAQEPERPRTKARIHRDLDAIVMMALRKEPERRYQTAEQLGEDIRRYVEGLPVKAEPDRFRYRASKFVSRNRIGMAAGALVLASLVGGLALSLREMRVARSERDHARLESARAQQVAAFLRGLFESSMPRQARGEKLTAQDLLDRGAVRVDRELARQPGLQASMLALLGSVYVEMGLNVKAESLLERSLTLREKAFGAESADVADSLYWLGRLRGREGNPRAALPLLQRSLEIRQRKGPDAALSETLSEVAISMRSLGRLEESEGLLERAIVLEEKNRGRNLHKWLTNLAAVEMDLGRYDRAQSLLERALQIGVRGERDIGVQVDVTLLNLAGIFRQQEDFSRAISFFERALAIDQKVYGADHLGNVYTLGEMGELFLAVKAQEVVHPGSAVGSCWCEPTTHRPGGPDEPA